MMLPELTYSGGLRVLMTADTARGMWQYTLDLAQGLRAYDTQTTLCVFGSLPASELLACTRRVPGLRLVCPGLPLDDISPRQVREAAEAVAALARAGGEEIIHLNHPALAAGPSYPAPVVAACHSCKATWWQAVRSGPLVRELNWHKTLFAHGLSRADAIIAPTAAFARAVTRTYKLPHEPDVIYSGCRMRLPETLAEGALSPPAKPFALGAGHPWDEAQGIRTLDQAASRLRTPVFVAGPLAGPAGTAIALQNARSLGRLSGGQLAAWLAAKPVFVSTACYESFGLPVLEAAQAGCALVLSDIPAFRELWEDAATFAPVGDAAAVAAAIASLAADDRQRALMASAARRRSKRYTVEVMAARMRMLYGGVLSSMTRKPIRGVVVA